MKKNDEYYTLITGASSGIGNAMSEEFARRQRNLLLIALPDTGLKQQCENLSLKYNILSHFLEIDFRNQDAPEMVLSFIHDKNLRINMLVNNIGVGYSGVIGDTPAEEINEMIMLNIYTTTHLTNLLLNELKSCPESYILNMGSFGAFVPAPYKSIYMASKAYIYYFSSGLRSELENSAVKVSVAMPGSVPSNKKMKERIREAGILSRYMVLSPCEVAKYIIARLFSGEKVIIPGKVTQAVYLLGLILPYGAVLYFMKKIFTAKKYEPGS
jgi:short-subunit dehydrogenase